MKNNGAVIAKMHIETPDEGNENERHIRIIIDWFVDPEELSEPVLEQVAQAVCDLLESRL
ncbi:MAG: hypothetical protein RR224_12585 [Clostridia bacterium]